MGSRRKKHVRSSSTQLRPFVRQRWSVAGVVAIAIALLFFSRWSVRTTIRRDVNDVNATRSGPSPAAPSRAQAQTAVLYADADVDNAANRLFAAVNPQLPENAYFPQFAKTKIAWVVEQRKAGGLSFILLKNVVDSGLSFEAMMASARPEGKPVIVLARPRFMEFLSDGGLGSAPFTRQQRNDFTLSLVHEVVHLENPDIATATTPHDHLLEEQRAWREVDIHVARELRKLNEPMNIRFLEADNAIKRCADRLPCEALEAILLPSESSRF